MLAYIKTVDDLAAAEAPPGGESSTETSGGKYETLIVKNENNQYRITLNRPKKLNAISRQMYTEWTEALHEAAEDTSSAITVITGAGDYFCSGNDLTNFADVTPDNMKQKADEGGEMCKKFVAAFIDHPKPLIVKVNGPAVGVCVTTMGLCDAVFATDRATFKTPFSILGQTAEGCSSYTFPRIMGAAKASQMLLFNHQVTAKEACDLGLVTQVFPDDVFDKEVEAILEKYASFPKQSMKYGKMLTRDCNKDLLHSVNKAECDRLVERWQSDECFKAISSFLQKGQ